MQTHSSCLQTEDVCKPKRLRANMSADMMAPSANMLLRLQVCRHSILSADMLARSLFGLQTSSVCRQDVFVCRRAEVAFCLQTQRFVCRRGLSANGDQHIQPDLCIISRFAGGAKNLPISVYMLRAVRSQPPGAHGRLPGAPGSLRAYGNYILPSVSSRKPSMSSWKLPYARASIWLSYHKLTPSVSSQRPSVSSQKPPVSSQKVAT